MEGDKKITVVRINGADYSIASSESEEYVRHIAFYVDKKMGELTKKDTRLSTALVAVLAAVNVADDYFRAQEDNEGLRAQLLKYAEENGKVCADLEQAQKEITVLKKENEALKINLAKAETELKQYHNNRR